MSRSIADEELMRSRGDHRFSRLTTRAAGVALQDLARSGTRLKEALVALERASDIHGRGVRLEPMLLPYVHPVADATGLNAEEVALCLIEQLRGVLEFALLDGGTIDDGLPGIVQLITSGRVELFAT